MQDHRRKTKTRVSNRQALQDIALHLTQEPVVIPDSSIPREPMMDVLAKHMKEQEIQAVWDYMAHPDTPGADRAYELRQLDARIIHNLKTSEPEKHAVRNYRTALERYCLFPHARAAFISMAADGTERSPEIELLEAIFNRKPKDRLIKIVPKCIQRLNQIIRMEKERLEAHENSELKTFARGLEYFREQNFIPTSAEVILEAGKTATLSPETEASMMLDHAKFVFKSQSILKFANKARQELEHVGKLLQNGRFR